MKLRDAQQELRQLGITLRSKNNAGEYRVNFKNGTEATAYYTDNLFDALLTGKDMARRAKEAK